MSAIFSPDRVYRYTLEREHLRGLDALVGMVDPGDNAAYPPSPEPSRKTVLFVGLNPSTADEETNDPTVRRMIGFAKRWRFDRLVVCNIFALRSTDPGVLYKHPDPIGASNDWHLVEEARAASMVVVAWGTHGLWHPRGGPVTRQAEVRFLLREAGVLELRSLGKTKHGAPKHPLYVRGDTQPEVWVP